MIARRLRDRFNQRPSNYARDAIFFPLQAEASVWPRFLPQRSARY